LDIVANFALVGVRQGGDHVRGVTCTAAAAQLTSNNAANNNYHGATLHIFMQQTLAACCRRDSSLSIILFAIIGFFCVVSFKCRDNLYKSINAEKISTN